MKPTGCGGSKCGWLSINGQALNITNYNTDDHDVCGTCQGCNTVFVGFQTSIPPAAQAFEGKNAAVVYHPPPPGAGEHIQSGLPDCPALPTPWQTLANKEISPVCSPYESTASLGNVETAEECLALAKATKLNSQVNYAIWRGTVNKSCDACAFRWRGPAEDWKYSNLVGATSFADYKTLPTPTPSKQCGACPKNPAHSFKVGSAIVLDNGIVKASFGSRGLDSISALAGLNVSTENDGFALSLDGKDCICSSQLPNPRMMVHQNPLAVSFVFASPSQLLAINVTYALRPGTSFVTKSIALTDAGGLSSTGGNVTRVVNSVSAS